MPELGLLFFLSLFSSFLREAGCTFMQGRLDGGKKRTRRFPDSVIYSQTVGEVA